jgi:hypothetical protein
MYMALKTKSFPKMFFILRTILTPMKTYRFIVKHFLIRAKIWILPITNTAHACLLTLDLCIVCALVPVFTVQVISWILSSMVHFSRVHLQRIPMFFKGNVISFTPPLSVLWPPLLTMEYFLSFLL